jgi:hypothetical protein
VAAYQGNDEVAQHHLHGDLGVLVLLLWLQKILALCGLRDLGRRIVGQRRALLWLRALTLFDGHPKMKKNLRHGHGG